MAPKPSKVCTAIQPHAQPAILTGPKFQQQICRLWMHTKGKPKAPTTYPIPRYNLAEDTSFPLSSEIELVEGIAYVAAVKKGVESVSASAIGLPVNPHDGLLVYVPSNDGVHSDVQTELQSIAEAMQGIASRGELCTSSIEEPLTACTAITREQAKDRILTTVIKMNNTRINARLKARKGGRMVVLHGLQEILKNVSKLNTTSGHGLNSLISRLEVVCQSLKSHTVTSKSESSVEKLKALTLACYHFWVASGKESTRDMLVRAGVKVDETQGNSPLLQVAKIAAYEYIARMMVVYASNKRFGQLFHHITICYVASYDLIQIAIPAMIAGGSQHCRVHAEVQLVLELEVNKKKKWKSPRAIGSSKAACFLCDLFIQKHGAYFVPRSHGLLTPFWVIPDPQLFTKSQRQSYSKIIDAMNLEILSLINQIHPHRLDPAMSWQALSRLGTMQYSRESSRYPTPAPTIAPTRTATPSVPSFGIPSVLAQVTTFQEMTSTKQESMEGSNSANNQNWVDQMIKDDPRSSHTILVHEGILATTQLRPTSPPNQSLRNVVEDEASSSSSPTMSTQLRHYEAEHASESHDLDLSRSEIASSICKGHGSHIRNLPSTQNTVQAYTNPEVATAYIDRANDSFAFHNSEVFFTFDDTIVPRVGTVTNIVPDDLSQNIIDTAELIYGKEITFDFEDSKVGSRTLYLGTKTRMNVNVWVKLIW